MTGVKLGSFGSWASDSPSLIRKPGVQDPDREGVDWAGRPHGYGLREGPNNSDFGGVKGLPKGQSGRTCR